MAIRACGDGRLGILMVVLRGEALRLCSIEVATQPIDFLFHLGVLGSFTDALEIGLDFARELESVAPRAAPERVLDNVATKLSKSDVSN